MTQAERREYASNYYRENRRGLARDYYIAGGKELRAKMADHRRERRQSVRGLIEAYKLANPCVCGESNVLVLGFPDSPEISMAWHRGKLSIADMLRGKTVSCLNCIRKKRCNITTTRESTRRRRLWVAEQKAALGCRDCGEHDPRALDYHHTEPGSKILAVARLTKESWKALRAEIEKCEVLCANCHAKHHDQHDRHGVDTKVYHD